MELLFFVLLLLSVGYQLVFSRRHNLVTLEHDSRKSFPLSTFGFLKGGGLMVEIEEFYLSCTDDKSHKIVHCPEDQFINYKFGFSVEKTTTDGVSNYIEQHTDKCVLQDRTEIRQQKQIEVMLFTFNFTGQRIDIERMGSSFSNVPVTNGSVPDKEWSFVKFFSSILPPLIVEGATNTVNRLLKVSQGGADKVASVDDNSKENNITNDSENMTDKVANFLPFIKVKNKSGWSYYGRITIYIDREEQEGLYNLYFHNCANYPIKGKIKSNLKLKIIEHNINTFLSAGEIHLPLLFGLVSVMFFAIGCIWISYLREHREWTFKVHYLMAALTFLKSFSLTFHAVNYYYIGRDGRQMETWAVLYYVTHLLKGALLFTTIVLIGTGFFFVKHVLSKKEKRIFMVVIPLQILANVANIILESTEEGRAEYSTWKNIFILVDLICCGAILFPVIWSIRHLQDAAQTDGKAAISLAKLKIFRHFYVMIVCYIYFTRIIVYLIKITVPFKFMWLDELCTELATFVFFVMTGYNFRPAPTNPYLHVPSDDEEDNESIEMQEISTNIGIAEGLKRVGRRQEIDTV